MKDDFWIQPTEGFTEEKRGRTEKEIIEKENSIGFRFPALYREHMKLQNGGYIRKRALVRPDRVSELLYNGATIDPLSHAGYSTLKDIVLESWDMEEALGLLDAPGADLERLPILSHMDGHSVLCFDYGYKQKEPLVEPEICLFELEGTLEERLRVKSYEKLVENLVYYGYESTSFFYGFNGNGSIAELAEKLNRKFAPVLQKETSDRFGWFNFDEWYGAHKVPLAKGLTLDFVLSPNRFRSGTYLFQDLPEYGHILEMTLNIGGDTYSDNSDIQMELLEKYLGSGLKTLGAELILRPYNNYEPTELGKMKSALES